MTANEPLGPLDPTDDFERDVRALMEGGFSAEKAMEMASNRGIKRPAASVPPVAPVSYVPAPPANTTVTRGQGNVVPMVPKEYDAKVIRDYKSRQYRLSEAHTPNHEYPNRGRDWNDEDIERLKSVLADLSDARTPRMASKNMAAVSKAMGRETGGVIHKARLLVREGKISRDYLRPLTSKKTGPFWNDPELK